MVSHPESHALIHSIEWPDIQHTGVALSVFRLDLVGEGTAQGNKYFKLKHNLSYAKSQGFHTVLSFGGVWSNHLHALAREAAHQQLKCIGVVRSDERLDNTAMLRDARTAGMAIHYVSRDEYRLRNNPDYWVDLARQFDSPYVIPEGGTNLLGAHGCSEIPEYLMRSGMTDYDVVALPVGSGGTLAGLTVGVSPHCHVVGYSVVRDKTLPVRIDALRRELDGASTQNWVLRDGCRTGSYGRFNRELAEFIQGFTAKTGIPLEPTYTGKMMYELIHDITQGYFAPGSRIVALHTGGMQGLRGHQHQLNLYTS